MPYPRELPDLPCRLSRRSRSPCTRRGPDGGQGRRSSAAVPPHTATTSPTGTQPVASAAAKSCTACHARADCLDCHRPNAASATPGYHPVGFLSRHPASAYARETSCAECHNTGAFCTDCHQQAGLTAQGALRGGFHDAKQNFLLGHGPAARQSLESCVSCHAQRDCLPCHSADGWPPLQSPRSGVRRRSGCGDTIRRCARSATAARFPSPRRPDASS